MNIPVKATPWNSFVTRRVRTDEKPLKQIRLISDYFEKVDKKVNSEGEHTKQTRIVDFFSKTTNEEGIEDNSRSVKVSKEGEKYGGRPGAPVEGRDGQPEPSQGARDQERDQERDNIILRRASILAPCRRSESFL